MSLFDFLFPEQAAASHLRRMADRQALDDRRNRIRDRGAENLERRIEDLEHDIGVLSLALAAILETANENGVISRDEIRNKISELDVLDGFRDGKLDVSVLRKWTN